MFRAKTRRTPRHNHIQVYKGDDGEWYWHLKAKNGRIIADSSEGYLSKAHAIRAAEGFREAASQAVITHNVRVSNG